MEMSLVWASLFILFRTPDLNSDNPKPDQDPDVDPLLLQVSKTVDHLHLRPSQAVEFGDHQFIPLLQRLQTGTQLVSFLQRCTGGHLLGEHLHASSTLQFSGLSSGVLMRGGTAGVPD